MNKKSIQIFLMVCDVAFIIIYSLIFHLSRPMNSTNVVYIPNGSITSIISYLGNSKFKLSPKIDKYMLYLIGKPQSGWINIGSTQLSRGDFLYKLATSKAALTKITLVPGETIDVFLYLSSKDLSLSYEKLMRIYLKKSPIRDGFIIPETYNVPIGMQEKHYINFLLSYSSSFHEKISKRIFGSFSEQSWYRYLIIASIIQKEAANKEEMKLVSSVIYNRLQKNMKLQMDGTLNYGKFSHIKVTPARIKTDNTKYNTYKFYGLPKSPVSSVEQEAIIAAIFPAKTNYLYFYKTKKGNHVFAKSYKEHLRNIKNR